MAEPDWQRHDIHYAARDGDAARVRQILQAEPTAVGAQERRVGWTAMHFAADNGALDVIQVLVDAGSPVDEPASKGAETPLLVACRARQYAAAELLWSLGANPRAADRRGETPMARGSLSASFPEELLARWEG